MMQPSLIPSNHMINYYKKETESEKWEFKIT